MKTILITGYAGFIGSILTKRLLDSNYFVIGIDNFNNFYDPQIKERNVSDVKERPNFVGIKGDILDSILLDKIFEENKIDVVIHLAASAGVRPSILHPVNYTNNNVLAHVNLLNSMQKSNVKNLIFASSSSVYGNLKTIPYKEDMILNNIQSPYAASKLSSEIYNKLFHDVYDFSIINLRFFTVYGPCQRPDLAIHKFTKMMVERQTLILNGNGTLKRDYTFVHDTIDGICNSIDLILNSQNIYKIYNLGNSKPISVLELVEKLSEITGIIPDIKLQSTPIGDVDITFSDISLARKEINYYPKTNLDKGLRIFWDWFKTNNNLS